MPSARPRALDKDVVCRVPGRGHSAKIWHTACPGVAECKPSANQGTRQRGSFAECWSAALGKARACAQHARPPCAARQGVDGVNFLPSASSWHLAKVKYCRVSPAGTRQSRNVAECTGVALGKASFAECWCPGTQQTWLKKFFLGLQIFLVST